MTALRETFSACAVALKPRCAAVSPFTDTHTRTCKEKDEEIHCCGIKLLHRLKKKLGEENTISSVIPSDEILKLRLYPADILSQEL